MKTLAKSWGFWLGSLLLWELTLHLTVYGWLDRFGMALGFSCAIAGILALLTGLPGWVGRICGWVIPPALFLVFAVQLVYYDIFGSLLSLGFVSMGGAAIGEFRSIAFAGIGRCFPRLVLMAVPLAAFCLLRRKHFPPLGWLEAATVWVGAVFLLCGFGTAAAERPAGSEVDQWAGRYGLVAAEFLDLRQTLHGSGGGFWVPDGGEQIRYDSQEWNVMEELDFQLLQNAISDQAISRTQALLAAGEDALLTDAGLDVQLLGDAQRVQALQDLNAYFSAQTPTAKNEYTGRFAGYNLIVVCAEAFSPYLVSQELTPTLYKLSHEGFVFQNFYNSFPNLTTNGEYCLNMGMWPDFSRMSFSLSSGNYLPFTLAKLWPGETTMAYHNNSAHFYNRSSSHPNMGYTFKAINMGLDMEKGNPSSDLEMMEKSVDDYLSSQPFLAYYMTYSGHGEYLLDKNDMSRKNQELVADMDVSELLRGYYACQLELEFAMSYLMERLEKAGAAERTVIVLTGDHMPYSLPTEDYAQLAGETVEADPFWQYRNAFICWNGGMAEPVVVDSYCCTQDILPTLLNLFGLPYDSRLLTGRDVLSDGEHMAVLKNGSILTDAFTYDGERQAVFWRTEAAEGDDPQEAAAQREAHLQELIGRVSDAFAVSISVLDTDYYRYVFSALDLLTDGDQEPEYVPGFVDIAGAWYQDEAEDLLLRGVLNGNDGGTFNGQQLTRRSAFIAMLSRGMQLPPSTAELPYEDLRKGGWYTDPIAAAWAAGLLPEGTSALRPDDDITQDEALEMMGKAAAYMGIPDSKIWAASAMDEVCSHLTQEEQGYLTRGASAVLVDRLLVAAESIPASPLPSDAP